MAVVWQTAGALVSFWLPHAIAFFKSIHIVEVSGISGAQSAHRVLGLLRLIGQHHPQGVRVQDLALQMGLAVPTVHRLVSCLLQEGYAERVEGSRRVRLGLEAMHLGLAATRDLPLVDWFTPAMKRIARLTGDTVFLVVRSGPDALCVHREEGEFPIKVFTIAAGVRRPLGLSAVGLAILADLPEEEVARQFEARRHDYDAAGLRLTALHTVLRATRRDGYAQQTEHRAAETSGVGCAARIGAAGYAGLSVAAINSRMNPKRRAEIGQMLHHELHARLGQVLATQGTARSAR